MPFSAQWTADDVEKARQREEVNSAEYGRVRRRFHALMCMNGMEHDFVTQIPEESYGTEPLTGRR